MIPACNGASGPDRVRVGEVDTLVAANAAPAILPDGAFGAMAELS